MSFWATVHSKLRGYTRHGFLGLSEYETFAFGPFRSEPGSCINYIVSTKRRSCQRNVTAGQDRNGIIALNSGKTTEFLARHARCFLIIIHMHRRGFHGCRCLMR